jgi:hypothetical protein
MDSSPERSIKRVKKQKLDTPDAQLTLAERNSILDKATHTVIRNRRVLLGSESQEYSLSSSVHLGKHKIGPEVSKVSPAFLITALEELHKFEESELKSQSMIDLERELEHLHSGIINRNNIIKKLRAELDEKTRILESLPRELVVNWVVSQRMMSRDQLDVSVLKTL